MRADQLAALDRLLQRMLALPEEARAAFVDALLGDDAAHAPALRALLAEPGLLDETGTAAAWSGAVRAAVADTFDAGPWSSGAMVGPYRLLRPLGEGGMGVVWLAERGDATPRRQVALKLPRPGLQRWRLGERFERERDILATLEHPHIARLYEAGVADDGQPWLAMEFVQGQPITSHAEAQRLDLPARLRLFLQVLAAVQHAHQRLVVHRDLKPSNILVDEQGRVRLLDFGIARLQDDGAPRTALTEVGQTVLTPRYAAPEQIAGGVVSTASDLYALGVVLCELLTGRQPYAPTRDTRAALEEAVLAGEVLRSSRLAPPALAARLRGDIDNIVLKALKKLPTERYGSAEAFAQDLQRHLDGVPVLAHPDSLAYRTRKFVRRNALAVGAGTAVALALLAGAAVALWQAREARSQAVLALREAERARAVQDFLVNLFNEADPARAQGHEPTVRDLMARAERELPSRLAAQPDSAAAVRGAMVDIYLKLGDDEHALPLAQAQAEQALRLQGEHSAEAGAALLTLGRAQQRRGRPDEALTTLQRALAVLTPLADARPDDFLATQTAIADALHELRREGEARTLLLQTLPGLVARYGASSWDVVETKSRLALGSTIEGRMQEAAAAYAEIEPLLEHPPAGRELDAAILRGEAGYAWTLSGRWADALRALQRSRDEIDRLEGPKNSDGVRAQRLMLVTLLDAGDYRGAAELAETNARRSTAFYGAADSEAARDQYYRVLPLLLSGQPAAAEAAARDALRVAEPAQALPPTVLRDMRRRLALSLQCNGHAPEALALLQTLAADETREGLHDGRTALTSWQLSNALRLRGAAGDATQAATLAAQAAQLSRSQNNAPAQLQAARALFSEALAWAAAGQAERATQRLDEGLALLKPRVPASHGLLRSAELVRAVLLRARGQAAAALALEQSTRAALRGELGIQLPPGLPLLP